MKRIFFLIALLTILLLVDSLFNMRAYNLKSFDDISDFSSNLYIFLLGVNSVVAIFINGVVWEWAFKKNRFYKSYYELYKFILPLIFFHVTVHDFIQDYVLDIGEGPFWAWTLIGLDVLFIVIFIVSWIYCATKKGNKQK
jgi:hypothetical protein